jgi:hypothetical protein
MKRLLLILVLAALCVGVLAAPASAHHKKPLMCRADIAVITQNGVDYFWDGTVRGDLRGGIEVWELPWADPGPPLVTFAESFVITTRCGDIKGFDMGIWYPDFRFRASGWVTEATGSWKYLVGWMIYEAGTTTDPNVDLPSATNVKLAIMPPLETGWGCWEH